MSKRILVVDDSALNRKLLVNVLKDEYEILEADGGRQTLERLEADGSAVSAVLLDIVMPEIDGYEVLRRIREDPLTAPIPVIMVTGAEDAESRVRALSLGANDFIQKPFNPAIVLHCLQNNIALRETVSKLSAVQRDKLTGLYNREAFFDKVGEIVAQHEPGHYLLSSFDIDNFKLINDRYGPAEGDRILREVGRAVGRNAEEIGAIAARIAGDNFAALVPTAQKDTEVLQRIIENDFIRVEQRPVTFSVGRYIFNDLSLSPSAAYDRAFIARQSVKGRYDFHLAYFDDAMLQKLLLNQQITGEMETALRQCQFEVWYQPQYNHATGTLLGAEALVRWRHPQKGILPPGDFIPLFEQNGFIYEMDKHVWREVCAGLRRWRDAGRAMLPVSVNISRMDLFRSDLEEVLTGLVQEYEIPIDLLRLEITESALTLSPDGIAGIIRKLIDLGFTVEIDDFGSGYSSLNTLKDIPAHMVKLDMRFLDGVGEDARRGGSILEAVVRMAKWLGMTVMAEGVEDADQADFLLSIGCSYVQGYLYARPMPGQEYESLLEGAEEPPQEHKSGVEEILFRDAFWDPKSVDSLIFNRYSGGACVYEFRNDQAEIIRVIDRYVHKVFGPGISAADIMKVNWQKHAAPGVNEALKDALLESSRTHSEVTGDYCFLDLPGCPHETWLRSSLRVLASTDNRFLVYCTSINITSQREAEQKKESDAIRLQAVMDNVGCGITAITYNGDDVEYLMINDHFLRILGYSREEYSQLESFSHIVESERSRVRAVSRQCYDTDRSETAEFRARRKDGSLIWLRAVMTMTRFSGVEHPVQLSMFSDITLERESEQELLDNLPGGAALYEYDGHQFACIHINQRYWKLMNRSPDNMPGQSFVSAVHPEDVPAATAELLSATREGRDISCNLRMRYGDTGYRLFHVAGRVVKKPEGQYRINVLYTPVSDSDLSEQ